MRGLGYKPDPAGHRKTSAHHLLGAIRSLSEPKSVSLLAHAPLVLDQQASSSCVGHAFACALKTRLWSSLPWVPSPVGIYTIARAIDRLDESIPLQDAGSEPNQAVRGIAEWGVRPIHLVDDHDAEIATVNDEPSILDLEDDARTLTIGAYGIVTPDRDQRRAQARRALAAGFPVPGAIAASGELFQSYTGGVLPALGPELDHMVCLVGYELTADGSTIWLVRNSWSKSWGEEGNFRLSDEAFDELGDLTVCDVAVKEAA